MSIIRPRMPGDPAVRRWALLALFSIPAAMTGAAAVALLWRFAPGRGFSNILERAVVYAAAAGAVPSLVGWIKWVSRWGSLGWSRWALVLLWPIVGAVGVLAGMVLVLLIAGPFLFF